MIAFNQLTIISLKILPYIEWEIEVVFEPAWDDQSDRVEVEVEVEKHKI